MDCIFCATVVSCACVVEHVEKRLNIKSIGLCRFYPSFRKISRAGVTQRNCSHHFFIGATMVVDFVAVTVSISSLCPIVLFSPCQHFLVELFVSESSCESPKLLLCLQCCMCRTHLELKFIILTPFIGIKKKFFKDLDFEF